MNQRSGDEWKAARNQCVTGTDVGIIMGCNQWVTPTKLLYQKITGEEPNVSEYGKYLMDLGTKFEGSALGGFEFEEMCATGKSVTGFVPGMTPHLEYSWLTGTPDFIIDKWGEKCIVEIKTHWYPTAKEAMPIQCVEDMPPKHWCQVQTYMEIFNYEFAYLYSWTLENGSTLFYVKRYKRCWEKSIFPQIQHFRDVYERNMRNPSSGESIEGVLRWGRGQKQATIDIVMEAMRRSTVKVEFGHERPIIDL